LSDTRKGILNGKEMTFEENGSTADSSSTYFTNFAIARNSHNMANKVAPFPCLFLACCLYYRNRFGWPEKSEKGILRAHIVCPICRFFPQHFVAANTYSDTADELT
jgi:hypothetical protein